MLEIRNVWVSQEQWRSGLLSGIIIADTEQWLLIAFTAKQYQQYTCACHCSVRVYCPRISRAEKFKREVCIPGHGPVRDSLITGRTS